MCLDAFLPTRSPRCLSTGCAHGVRPSEHDLTEIVPPLGVPSPPAIGDRVASSRGRSLPACRGSLCQARSGLSACRPPDSRMRRAEALRPSCAPSQSPRRFNAATASLQGFRPSVGWDRRRRISPACHAVLALLGFSSLRPSPSLALGPPSTLPGSLRSPKMITAVRSFRSPN